MNGAEVMDVGRDALWLTIQLCAPVLLVGLVVGVVIGLAMIHTYDHWIDESAKWSSLPYPQAIPHVRQVERV